ncbi:MULTISPECIES: DUF4230 domain-containing protein [Flavobacterium]|uniref:DUF4230 domain-containing protein n=1 Tax=Flavobacterium TaxID=237 RepID=UPI00086E0258|nr:MULTISPECIES: DUF4230 domain-containing protein [Flavobacterium]MBN9283282.1 DUF4230 domain-containing protein [Flavobacterium sp.]ODS84881.1 MAG: hypothetical protein ABS44_16150 [Chryseobacterium sp. SCN 40-13]OJV70069.1 MAG: hypothetical protein BGO42_11360 [Flavobacterium sp. 40-81]
MLVPVVQALARSGKIIYLLIFIIIGFVIYKFVTSEKATTTTEYNTDLIQQQIRNVGKLVVTEGHYAQVMTYKDQQKYLMDLLTFEKKALIIINADVTVAYDLRQIKYDIDEKNKTITILNIPKEEIKISPDIQFYDVDQSRMNPFTGDDYNKINKKVKADLAQKIEKSALKTNAKNRLISELSKLLILTNSMGWKLEYENRVLDNEQAIGEQLKL